MAQKQSNLLNFVRNISISTTNSEKTTEQNEEEAISEAEEAQEQEIETNSEDEADENELQKDSSPPKKRKKSHKLPGRGHSKFLTNYANPEETIEASKRSGYFFCKACNSDLALSKNGQTLINDHIKTKKHKDRLADFRKNQTINQFIKKRTENEEKSVLLAEILMAFHSGAHNFSMQSSNCTSELLPKLFKQAEDFASARDKTTAIINGVIYPFLQKRFLSRIKLNGGYYSIGIDSTEIQQKRFHAVVIRYFDIEKGTKQRLLKIVDESSEKAVDMANLLKQVLIENDLELTKMAALTADNTNANFGGLHRRGQNNLFYLLKQDHPSLNGIGCVSHIDNNSIRHAVEQLNYDIENFCTKLCGHFNTAIRWEYYKKFATNFQIKILKFPDYCPTRWLSLKGICDQICGQWEAIESYFRSCRNAECPKFMRNIFNDELTPKAEEYRILFSFCSFALGQFNKFNLISQKQNLAFPEMMKALLGLKRKIQQAHDENYFGNEANERLIRLEEEGSLDICGRLKAEFLNFYENSLEYLNKWSAHVNELADFVSDWLIFEERPTIQKISNAYKKFCGRTPDELDNLFNEVAELNELLDKLTGTGFEDKEIEERWTTLFKNKNFVLIKKPGCRVFGFWRSHPCLSPNARLEFSPGPLSGPDLIFAVQLRATAANGIVMFATDERHNQFAVLYLQDGKPAFASKSAQGQLIIQSNRSLLDDEWHSIRAQREGPAASLNVNGQIDVEKRGGGGANGIVDPLELQSPIFVGGLPPELVPFAARLLPGVKAEFGGCLRAFTVNDAPLDGLSREVGTAQCSQYTEQGLFFGPDGGYAILSRQFVVGISFSLEMEIKPRTKNAVLVSVGVLEFLNLQLINGSIKFSVDNGAGVESVIYEPPQGTSLCDGHWHQVKIYKKKKLLTLNVDGKSSLRVLGKKSASETSTKDPLYVGGVPRDVKLKGLDTQEPYVGCLRVLFLGKKSRRRSVPEELVPDLELFGSVDRNTCPLN